MPRTRGQEPAIEQSQNYTDEKLSRAVPSWITDGHELSAELPVGATKVPHGLGRAPRGWMVQRLVYNGLPPVLGEITANKNSITFVHAGPNVLKLKLWVW